MDSAAYARPALRSLSPAALRVGVLLAYYLFNAVNAATPFSVVLTLPMLVIVLLSVGRIRSPHLQVADMLWFCVYLFFAIGPMQSMGPDGVIGQIGGPRFAYDDVQYAMAMTIAVLFVLPLTLVPHASIELPPFVTNRRRLFALLAISVLSGGVFVLTEGGLSNLLSARLEQSAADKFIGSLLFLGFQTVSAFLFIGEARAGGQLRKWWLPAILVLGMLLLTRNPFNAPRFMLVAAWLPIVIVLFRGRISINSFYALCTFSLIVAFPILSATTRLGVGGLDVLTSIDYAGFALHVPFVDIYDTLVQAVRYVDMHGLAWGAKTVAVLLFFVPRVLWPEKPIVGGLDVGYELFNARYVGTPNLSFLLGGDFYLDFHLIGVALLSVLTAMVVSQAITAQVGVLNRIPVMRIVFLASLPILLRGPVGAILPLFTCQIAAIWLIRFALPNATPTNQLNDFHNWYGSSTNKL